MRKSVYKKINFSNFFPKIQIVNIQPNIINFVNYLGKYDVGIDIKVKSAHDFRNLLKEIKERFRDCIESYHSVLIYKEHKLSYLPRIKAP